MRKCTILLTGVILVLAAVAAQAATVTVVAQYTLGDNDPGAANGLAGNAVTKALPGTDAGKQGTGQFYSNNTPGPASTLSMSFPDTNCVYYKAPVYDLGTDNWGMEAWVYSTDAGNGGWAYSNGSYEIGQFGGSFYWNCTSQGPVATTPIAANAWHHLALVRAAGTLTAYLDGVALPSTNRTDIWGYDFAIGARGNGGLEPWAGLVDHVRLFTFTGTFNPQTDLSLNMVPEPSAFVLLTCGAVALLAYAWRKRK